MPNKPEQLLHSTALTARTMPWLTSAPCQPARPLSTMMPELQPPGHGVLAKAAISRIPPELNGNKRQQTATNGNKWQQMALFTKIRIWDDATSYKKSVKNGVICAKACKNPIFPGQTAPFSGNAPALTNGPATGTKWQQMALFTKIRIWDDAISYKKSVKNGVIRAKACKNPIFLGQTVPFSGKAPVPRHPRRSGDPEPLWSSTRLENGGPAPAPAARHCCPNRVGA